MEKASRRSDERRRIHYCKKAGCYITEDKTEPGSQARAGLSALGPVGMVAGLLVGPQVTAASGVKAGIETIGSRGRLEGPHLEDGSNGGS